MNTTIEIPALDGRDPLGFLAALGIARTLRDHDVRLSWSSGSGAAQVTSGIATIDDLASALAAAISEMDDDEVAPGLDSSILPNRSGSKGSDPARIDPAKLRSLITGRADPDELAWIRALWTDLSDDKEGRCARSPFNAPAGQQTFRSMFAKPLDHVRADPEGWMRDAVTRWTRVAGYTGEGLESRAMRDAAEVSDGDSTSYGVPGATYLALLALPMFPVTGNGVLSGGATRAASSTRRLTPGWHRTPPSAAPARMVFVWPLWRQPLDPLAISVLLDHPDVVSVALASLQTDNGRRGEKRLPALAPLGVWATVVASRRTRAGGKSEGFLTTEKATRVA